MMKKILIFGLGSIGTRYAKIIRHKFNYELVAFRSSERRKNRLGIPEIHTWKQAKEFKPDIAIIANPTFLHVDTALKCAALGAHLFIEKPLSNSLKKVDLLESICRKKQLTCYTAYCLRFHPVIAGIKKLIKNKEVYHARLACSSYLPYWRKGVDHKQTYSASSRKGGGVLLDLSHEFDYIQFLFGRITSMKGNFGKLDSLTLDAEDFADILINTDKGAFVNLHLNFFSFLNERRIVINFKGGYLIGDLLVNRIELFAGKHKRTLKFSQHNDYFFAQLKYFLNNIGNGSIMNNLRESVPLLRKIIEFKNA